MAEQYDRVETRVLHGQFQAWLWARGAPHRPVAALRAERAHLALWTPVALGVGVWVFFTLSTEPPPFWGWIAAGGGLAALSLRGVFSRWMVVRLVVTAVALVAVGFAAASWRTWSVAAPVLSQPLTTVVEGRVIAIESRGGDRWRLVLDRLAGEAGVDRLARIRIDVPAPSETRWDWIGARVRLTARLRPPAGPAAPSDADFRLRAWMAQIGATGSARSPPERVAAAEPQGLGETVWLSLQRLRIEIAARAVAATRSQDGADTVEGAVIAALLVGDRSRIDPDVVAALRESNLAHLLAISGLHMGIVCLTVFFVARLGLALAPEGRLAVDPKKTAAVSALAAGAVYLALSGAAVSTERAFLMAAVAFGAVLVDRPAVTLRAVAVAATIILLWRPESLFSPGFQLSFAATTAMVAAFTALRGLSALSRRPKDDAPPQPAPTPGLAWLNAAANQPVLRWLGALLVSATVAGAATAPFAAHTFNRLTNYGLLANLAAAPAMGLVVMPLGVAAALLAPFGLDGLAFQAMAFGVGYVIWIAETVAALPNATRAVPAASATAIALITFGGLQLCLWRGAVLRSLGLALLALGASVWSSSERPDVLVGPRGALVGVATPFGRSIDRADAEGFVARRWLEKDGDAASPREAASRPGFARFRGGATAIVGPGWRVETILGQSVSLGRVRFRCRRGAVLVVPRTDFDLTAMDVDQASIAADGLVWRFSPERWCLVFDRGFLSVAAPLAIDVTSAPPSRLPTTGAPPSLADLGLSLDLVHVVTAARFGARLWSDDGVRSMYGLSVD